MDQISDAVLLANFLSLCGSPTLDRDARAQGIAMIKFLRQCEYTPEEVCAVLAHASKYFADIHDKRGTRMGAVEASNIMVAQAYIAHSFVLDVNCPLSWWHRCLCRKYCSLAQLDSAIIRLMKLREYKLRLDDGEMQHRYSVLVCAAAAART